MGRVTDTVKVLIIINVLVFIGTLLSGDLSYRLFALFYFENPNFQIWQPITHMFMHGSFMHILFNMYALWAFGSPLEMRWGRGKFLFFYFSAGLGAMLVHSLVTYYQFHTAFDVLLGAGFTETQVFDLIADIVRQVNESTTGQYSVMLPEGVAVSDVNTMVEAYETKAVGASGAIYGVLVAFGLMFPNIELMLIFLPVPIKAKFFIPGLILLDIFFGITGSPFGIAHWAHIGGALFGFIMAWYWRKNNMDKYRWN